jgi:methionine synthase I (cobalamin-dependent)
MQSDSLNRTDFDRSFLGTMFREISAKMMYDFVRSSVSHCLRACNSVAHALAAIGLNCNTGPVLWQDHLPEHVAVHVLVSSELAGQSD